MKKSSRFASFFCLFSTLLVTSCGKSLEQSTEELNKVFKALSNLEEISVVFTRNQDDVDSVQSLISIMDSEEGLEILKKSNLKEKFLSHSFCFCAEEFCQARNRIKGREELFFQVAFFQNLEALFAVHNTN